MSGAGTFAIAAQPGADLVFTPHPTYWLTFGSYTPGQVLDPAKLPHTLEVTFPPDVFALQVTLDKNHHWTTSPR